MLVSASVDTAWSRSTCIPIDRQLEIKAVGVAPRRPERQIVFALGRAAFVVANSAISVASNQLDQRVRICPSAFQRRRKQLGGLRARNSIFFVEQKEGNAADAQGLSAAHVGANVRRI